MNADNIIRDFFIRKWILGILLNLKCKAGMWIKENAIKTCNWFICAVPWHLGLESLDCGRVFFLLYLAIGGIHKKTRLEISWKNWTMFGIVLFCYSRLDLLNCHTKCILGLLIGKSFGYAPFIVQGLYKTLILRSKIPKKI